MKTFTHLFLSVCAVAALAGCSGKDGDPGPAGATGPAGPSLTGNLFGFVSPVDEFGNSIARNGVTVALEGVTPATTVTTNADGRYEFAGLRTGTYNLSFSRTGITTFRRLGVAHVGGDQPTFLGTNTISAASTTAVGPMSLSSLTTTAVSFSVPFSNTNAPSGTFLRYAIFASASPGVNATNGVLLVNSSASISPSNINISKATLNTAGFASGTPVYVVAYGVPQFWLSYPDPANGRPVYLGLGTPSNQVAFIAP